MEKNTKVTDNYIILEGLSDVLHEKITSGNWRWDGGVDPIPISDHDNEIDGAFESPKFKDIKPNTLEAYFPDYHQFIYQNILYTPNEVLENPNNNKRILNVIEDD